MLPRLSPDQQLSLHPTPKWIRAHAGGRTVVDSRRAALVRAAHPPPRTYAVPLEDAQALPPDAGFEHDGHVVVHWDAMDHWYEEDEEVFIHPRDPDKRIDVLASSRRVEVALGGEVLAESGRPTLLFEEVPHLPVRYYLRHADVDVARLRPSKKTTGCPYKGWAAYYDVNAGGTWHRDLAWTYRTPLREVEPIRGLVCFFNERVDITEDGVALERPVTPFS